MVAETQYALLDQFPGYRVGNDGTVWTSKRNGRSNSKEWIDGWRLLTLTRSAKGYLYARLYRPGEKKCKFYHVAALVLSAFVGPRPTGHEAAHSNGIRDDNCLANLSWKTKLENERDKEVHGTLLMGERVHCAKLTAAKVIEIRSLKGKMRRCDVARRYGIGGPSVGAIWDRKLWKHV